MKFLHKLIKRKKPDPVRLWVELKVSFCMSVSHNIYLDLNTYYIDLENLCKTIIRLNVLENWSA